MAIAELDSLTVKYDKVTAVNNLSCEIPEGCVGLLGPNGAGKTTLIKAMLGFVTPFSGSGKVLGYDILHEPLSVRMNVGLMPEIECYIPGLTAVEFVAYCGELCGMPRSQAMRRAHEVLDYVGLGEARYRLIDTYSTGMKQRAKLAQGLVHGPHLLFLDEPTNGLDPAGRDEMLTLIKDISHGKGVNILLSSHLLPDIERTCDYVIVMQKGEIRAKDTVENIRRTSALQYDIELKEPSDDFEKELEKFGAKVISRLSHSYRVQFTDGVPSVSQAIFLAAKNSNAQVRSLRQAQRTLEDAFLEALQ